MSRTDATTSNTAQNITMRIEYPPLETSSQKDRLKILWFSLRTLIRTRRTIQPGTAPGEWMPFLEVEWWRQNRRSTQ
jgi:hypothetical protein